MLLGYIPGHGVVILQDWLSMGGPPQNAPPLAGSGLSHEWFLVCRPVSQIPSHGPQADHSLQPPFTAPAKRQVIIGHQRVDQRSSKGKPLIIRGH